MHRTSDRSRFHTVPRVLDACFDVGGAELHLLTTIDGRKYQRVVPNRTEEIDLLLTWLAARSKLEGYNNVRVVVEATGVYHELVLRMARMRGMETCFVSAEAASKNRVVLFGDTGKTDKRDPVAIADLAARDVVLRHRDLSDEYLALRSAGVLYAKAERSGIAAKNRVHRAMRRVFPDFDFSSSFLFSRSGRAVFRCTGFDPFRIVRSGKTRLTRRLKRIVPRIRHQSIDRLLATAKMSMASASPPITHQLYLLDMKQAWQDLVAAEQRKQDAQVILEDLYDKLLELDPSLPAPQKGLASRLSLARLVAETGSFSDFTSWREVLKYIGLNLRERQSGRYRGKTKVSKKGRVLARHVLNQMVVPLVKRTRLLGPWYRHMIDVEKKPGPVAITAAARKLVKVLWGWSKSDQDFDEARVFSCAGDYKAAA
jgi:transposase